MAHRSLLLMDADPQSSRVLEVSLRKAGYKVATVTRTEQASGLLREALPDIVLLDPGLEEGQGLVWLAALRRDAATSGLPVMAVCAEGAGDLRAKALALGVDDYVQKPLYVREVLARVDLVLSRHERESLRDDQRTQMSGSLVDLSFVDLLQTIDVSRKTGVLNLHTRGKSGAVFFRDGRVVDAQLGVHAGDDALYRFLSWSVGDFELVFRPVRSEDKLGVSTPGILMECMRRLDARAALIDDVGPLEERLDVDRDALTRHMDDVHDDDNTLLGRFAGGRAVNDVLDVSPGDELVLLGGVARLVASGILVPASRVRVDTTGLASTSPGSASAPAEPPASAPAASGPSKHTLRPDGMFAAPAEPSPTSGGMRLAGVQLRRVAHPARGERSGTPTLPAVELPARESLKKPERPDDVKGVRGDARAQEEADAAMAKQSKRKAQPGGEAGESANVIPLKVGRQEPVERSAELAPAFREPPQPLRQEPPRPRAPAGEAAASSGARTPDTLHEDDDPEIGAFFAEGEPRGSWASLRRPEPHPEPREPAAHAEDHEEPAASTQGKRTAITIAALGALVIGGFLLYHKVLMPTPADLGPSAVSLPTPELLRHMREPEPSAAVQEAPSGPVPPVAAASVPAAPMGEPALAEPAPVVNAVPDPTLPAPLPAAVEAQGAPADGEPDPLYATLVARAQKLGFKKGAEAAYLQALALHPAGADALSGLAMLYLNQGKNEDARQRAEEALQQRPDDSTAWIVLGATYSADGDAVKAREAYAKCAALPGKYAAECKRMLR